ncbi:MAG: hypothetical protein ACYS8L_05265, partial [Planctomycetota bacterium]
MEETPINTEGRSDAVLIVLFLLFFVTPSCEAQQAFVAPLLQSIGILPKGAARDIEAVAYVSVLLVVLLPLFLAYVALRSLLASNRTFQVVKAAVMVPIGGSVAWVLGSLACLAVVMLTFFAGARWAGVAALALLVLVPGCFAGLWGGWRFGKWGWLWGGLACLPGVVWLACQVRELLTVAFVAAAS